MSESNMAFVLHEVGQPETNGSSDDASEEPFDVTIRSRKSFYMWRKYIFGILVAVFFVISLPIVIWSALKTDKENELASFTQVEKVISDKVTCSKSSEGIECSCSANLVWNGTHCNERINGSWCEWHPISHCNVSCGYGYQEMIRRCSCPAPKYGGSFCEGPIKTLQPCNPSNCSAVKYNDKVNGGWCDWLLASPCNTSCGYGHQEMMRYCECPAPENGGSYCSGKNQTALSCYQGNCTTSKVNGGWCEWHKASPCNTSCGVGRQEMIRYCSCPSPGNGGSSCFGQNQTVISCFEANCGNFTTNETCDFEFGLNKEKCYWTQDTKDDFDWKREHSGLVLYDVRPNTDHTLRKHYGHYMHIQYKQQQYMDKARLLSGVRGATNMSCLKFWYDIQGPNAGSLNVYKINAIGSVLIWKTSGNQGNRWQYGFVEFHSPIPYQLAIEGTVGRGSKGSSDSDVAIDDVSLAIGRCPLPETIKCNHTFVGSSGSFSSPFYPDAYPDNALCFYRIQAPLGYSIQIKLYPVTLQSSISCVNDSLKIYDGGLLKKTYCGNYIYVLEYKSIESTVVLVFQSDASVTDRGFKVQYTTSVKPCHFNLTAESGKFDFPIPSYPWRKCHFSIDVSSGKIINISFTGSSFPKASYYCGWTDYIAIYESSFSASNLMRKICNNGSTVYRSFGNTVYLEFLSSSSRVFASYSVVSLTEDCSYNLTSKFNRVMSPGYPSSYPNGVFCKYFFEAAKSNAVKVQFTHMNLEMQPTCGDFITFYDLNNGMEQRLCKNQNGIVWTSRGNRALMTFKTDARSTSSGFSGFFYQITRPCNYTFLSPSGNFTSPGYPEKFPKGITCEFQIKAPFGKSVKIDFYRSLYPYLTYCQGYVAIYEEAIDGRNAKLQFCGIGPKTYQSFSNNVYVVFVSKPTALQYKGFSANYSVVDQVCSYVLEPPIFNFTSPGYPNDYPNSLSCQYRFTVPRGQAMKIHFSQFSLESSQSCVKDSVSVYENGILNATFCGTKFSPSSWSSIGDVVLMTFQSDQFVVSKGFYGYYSVFTNPCELWFKSSSDSFTSPGYPDAHRKGVICWYHIAVSSNKSIKIDFSVISLKNNSVCFDEYIKIYEDTTTTEDTLKAKYCGQGARTFYSYSNIVHIRFKPVYYSPQLPVFSANYSEIDKACIYTITPAHRYATSPGFPNNYFNKLNCKYYMQFPENQVVKIKFNRFSVQSSESCTSDSVKLFEKDTLKATYCGTSASTWTSTQNNVHMIFTTDASVTSGGFFAYVTASEKACEHFFTSSTGNFSSSGFPGPYPLGKKCLYHISVSKGKSVKIDFHVFYMLCAMEKVYIYEDETAAYKLRAVLCGSGPKSFTSFSNKVVISFLSNKFYAREGFFGIYSEVNKVCNYILAPPVEEFSSPGYEYGKNYANNSYCRYHINVPDDKAIKISFHYMSLESSESCSKDWIRIYEGDILRRTFCSYKSRYLSWSSQESNVLMIFQSDSSNSSRGFYGSYSVVNKPCDYTFTSPSGFFKSPEIPCKFTRGTECKYHITVANGKGIKIEFPFFQLLDSSSCSDEYVAVYEETIKFETRKATFCGNSSRTFHSYSNKVHLVFHSSLRHKSYQGFHANYSEIERVCNYTLMPPSYTFSSPAYPDRYPNVSDCQYHFKVSDGNAVRMNFNLMSLPSSPSCAEASVKIYEGNTLKETFCGENPVTRLWSSTGSEILMTFHANTSVTSRGFYGSFYPIVNPCSYSYTSESGNFSSVGYPNKYQDRSVCNYNIKVKQGNSIRLNFDPFDLEYSLTCRYDYLKIYNIFPSNIHLAATFCGTGVRTFQSNSSEVLVEFRSDESTAGNGFFVKYISVN